MLLLLFLLCASVIKMILQIIKINYSLKSRSMIKFLKKCKHFSQKMVRPWWILIRKRYISYADPDKLYALSRCKAQIILIGGWNLLQPRNLNFQQTTLRNCLPLKIKVILKYTAIFKRIRILFLNSKHSLMSHCFPAIEKRQPPEDRHFL